MCAAHPLPEQRAGVGVAGFDAGGDGAPGRYVQSLGSTVVLGALPSSLTLEPYPRERRGDRALAPSCAVTAGRGAAVE